MRIFLSTFAATVANIVLQSPVAATLQGSSLSGYNNVNNLVHKVKDLTLDTNERRLEGDGLQLYCDILESTGEFDCQCNEATKAATCVSSELCEGGICATFSLTTDFAPDFSSLELVEVCINYTKGPPELRDGCGSFTVDIDGELETCKFFFDNDADVLTKCNSCDICTKNGQEGINLDCGNIEPEATTNGCETAGAGVDDESAAATEAVNLFPGFDGDSEKSGSGSGAAAAGPVGAMVAILTAAVVAGFGA